ncbi:MAG: hypothetical protein ACO1OC_08095 [Tuberibacillus sp.]
MFDPTVFDNLKVVLEGAIYELDFKGQISIVDRSDIVDLAKMSRAYSLTLANKHVEGLVEISTDVENWSGEIMEAGTDFPCHLFIQFFMRIDDIDMECSAIKFRLSQIWRTYKPKIEQQITFIYNNNVEKSIFHNQINLFFNEPIDESFITDIPHLISLVVETLNGLEDFAHS